MSVDFGHECLKLGEASSLLSSGTDSAQSLWCAPPEELTLSRDEIHVWRAALDSLGTSLASLQETLSPDERARAAQFRFLRDRQRFIVARGVLRNILARYLRREPAGLKFSHNSSGKPALAGESGASTLHFNLSHSHGLALFGVAMEREVGIDLERIRTDFASEEVAQRFFSPRDVAALAAFPASQRQEAFFDCWTRKEAFAKARGEGLSILLDPFDASVGPEKPAAVRRTEDDPPEVARWRLERLAPGSGYAATLAAEGHGWQLKYWQWQAK